MSKYRCPCCGGEMPAPPAPELLLELKVSPLQRRILECVARAYPGHAKTLKVIDAMYWDDPNGGAVTARNAISVHSHRLNEKLAPFGWQIGCFDGFGTLSLRQIEQVAA